MIVHVHIVMTVSGGEFPGTLPKVDNGMYTKTFQVAVQLKLEDQLMVQTEVTVLGIMINELAHLPDLLLEDSRSTPSV